MSKKPKKKRNSAPPLSGLDKLIYGVCIVLAAAVLLSFVMGFGLLIDYIAFCDGLTAAYRSGASMVLALPFVIYLIVSLIIVGSLTLGDKKPIFGNKNIQYGKYPWPENLYPLFDERRRRIYKSPAQKGFERSMLIVWAAGFLITLLFAPFGLCARECLNKDGSIHIYNALNHRMDESYSPEDYDGLSLKIYFDIQRYHSQWTYSMEIKMEDGESFSFKRENFDHTDLSLDSMLKIKAMFPPERVSIEGAENLQKLIHKEGFDEAQQEKLRELFS